MRIGYITCYNTPDNLRIALEDNLIEISAKNSENHRLRINSNTFIQIALQCNAASHVIIRVCKKIVAQTSLIRHSTKQLCFKECNVILF